VDLFPGSILCKTFPDFVKFKDICKPGKLICYFPGHVATLTHVAAELTINTVFHDQSENSHIITAILNMPLYC